MPSTWPLSMTFFICATFSVKLGYGDGKSLYIPESDLAGVVVDANGTELKDGEQVFGWIPVRESLFLLRLMSLHPENV